MWQTHFRLPRMRWTGKTRESFLKEKADFMISSPLMDGEYDCLVPDYETYTTRKVDLRDEDNSAEEV